MSNDYAKLLRENKITGDQYVALQLENAEVEKTKAKAQIEKTKANIQIEKTKANTELKKEIAKTELEKERAKAELEKEKVKTELENKKINADVEKTKAKAEVLKKVADVKIAQIENLGRAVSSLSNALNNPVYEESDYSETEYERAILPFGDPKVKKRVKRTNKRVDQKWMQHKERMAADIMQIIEENKRDTFQALEGFGHGASTSITNG